MNNSKFSSFFIGFLQALGVFIYCILVAILLRSGEQWFGKGMDPFLGITLFLLLFCASALICALLVGAYPAYIYFTGSKENLKRSLTAVIWSGIWLLIFLAAFLLVLISF